MKNTIISRPGMKPPMNKRPMDTSPVTPYMTSGIDGGMVAVIIPPMLRMPVMKPLL